MSHWDEPVAVITRHDRRLIKWALDYCIGELPKTDLVTPTPITKAAMRALRLRLDESHQLSASADSTNTTAGTDAPASRKDR